MDAYKERMIVEYDELKERTNKLENIVLKAQNNKLDFELNCPVYLLRRQLRAMQQYLNILKERAVIEEVELND